MSKSVISAACFWDTVPLCSLRRPWNHYIVQADLNLTIILCHSLSNAEIIGVYQHIQELLLQIAFHYERREGKGGYGRYIHATAHVWRSRQLARSPVLSSHGVGPRDGTQVIVFRSKCLCLLSHLISPKTISLLWPL